MSLFVGILDGSFAALRDREDIVNGGNGCSAGASPEGARQMLTLEAVVKLEEVAVLQLPSIDDLVVCDVAVWTGGRFPFQTDLRGRL